MRAAWWAANAVAQAFGVQLKFRDGAAERIAVHAQLAGSLALVAFVVLQHGRMYFFLNSQTASEYVMPLLYMCIIKASS